MKKNKLAKAIAPLLLSVSVAASSADIASESGVGINNGFTPSGTLNVLWDQITGLVSTNGAPDQDFEAAFDVYDSWGADDFVVGGFGWSVQRVNTQGTYSAGGPVNTVDVAIQTDAGGAPSGTAVCDYSGLTVSTDVTGSYGIDLPTSCDLPTGTYWLVMQSNMDFGVAGQHFWSNTTTTSGNLAHWINPGDGFGSGCTSWQPAGSVCGVGGGVPFDNLFSLEGTMLPPPIIPSLNWLGLTLMFLTLGFVGHKFIKKQEI
ncbi:MAG: hypothetical protein R3F25_12335 [Gammaproteobacteria bacterium]|jgi:hypothetical protein|nr:hypothetical protein [Xanthomonadales bacterium]